MSVFDLNIIYFTPQRSIDTLKASVTVEEIHEDALEITDFPIDSGANITDHAYIKPISLEISCFFSVFQAPLSETYQKLLDLQASRQPFDVVTGKRSYKNMLLQILRVNTDRSTENILSVQMSLRQITIVSVEQTSVPASKSNQKTPESTQPIENAGEKTPEKEDAQKSQSILNAILG
jgi:hypothetical protein